jgi:hypothetical protein
MSVILNEGAITRLFEAPEGPVARFVERVAEAVVVHAQVQFDEYFHGVLPARQDIGLSMDGSTATIGYVDDDGSPKAKRLAAAEQDRRLTHPPIRNALQAVRDGR